MSRVEIIGFEGDHVDGLFDGVIQVALYGSSEYAQAVAVLIEETLSYIEGSDHEIWLKKNADGTTKLGNMLESLRVATIAATRSDTPEKEVEV